MTDQELEIVARAAGLDKALRDFRGDVVAAAEVADKLRRTVTKPMGAADEPWPPMRTESTP